MERLTDERAVIKPGTYLVSDDLLDDVPEIRNVSKKELYYRLGLIENALGKNYDLGHLRELIEADREGRCAILSEPMKPMIYKPNDTDVYCPTCGETLSGGWPLVEWEDRRTMYQCPYCGQSIDTQVCEPYESALKAMKERE